MDHRATLLFLALALLAMAPGLAFAQAPAIVPVQGTLADAEGAPLAGEVEIAFRLYDAPTEGNLLHEERLTVEVEHGAFTAYLGSSEPLDLAIFRAGGSIYLGLAVADDPEMTPRLAVGTVPFAAFAEHAGDAQTLQGASAADFATAEHGHDWGDLADTAHTHPWTDITGVPADLADGDDVGPSYSAGPGITITGSQIGADPATIQSWARDACYDTPAEITGAIGPHFTSSDAVAAMGAKTNANPLHHDRYTNAQAVTAMGAKSNANPLHHDRYTDAEAVAAAANSAMVMTACPGGYSAKGTNLCISGWRTLATFYNAQSDCFDEGAHVCTYAEYHYLWNALGDNPAFLSGDWIGDVVGDDQVLCVNNTTNSSNFEGICAKGESHYYQCCMGRGR